MIPPVNSLFPIDVSIGLFTTVGAVHLPTIHNSMDDLKFFAPAVTRRQLVIVFDVSKSIAMSTWDWRVE
jgi:hypothetical protein